MSRKGQNERKLKPDPSRDWLVSREQFLRSIAIGGVAINLPWLTACSSGPDDFGDTSPLNSRQFITLRELLSVLFPNDGNGPGALEVNADRYILWVLNDPLLDPVENEFIIDKLDKFIETCKEQYAQRFEELSEEAKQSFVRKVADDWGKTWISRLLTLIFEALLTDPKYGGNPDHIGWEWLQHDPGVPRPSIHQTYPNILEK